MRGPGGTDILQNLHDKVFVNIANPMDLLEEKSLKTAVLKDGLRLYLPAVDERKSKVFGSARKNSLLPLRTGSRGDEQASGLLGM
jgi:hypothetical protein